MMRRPARFAVAAALLTSSAVLAVYQAASHSVSALDDELQGATFSSAATDGASVDSSETWILDEFDGAYGSGYLLRESVRRQASADGFRSYVGQSIDGGICLALSDGFAFTMGCFAPSSTDASWIRLGTTDRSAVAIAIPDQFVQEADRLNGEIQGNVLLLGSHQATQPVDEVLRARDGELRITIPFEAPEPIAIPPRST